MLERTSIQSKALTRTHLPKLHSVNAERRALHRCIYVWSQALSLGIVAIAGTVADAGDVTGPNILLSTGMAALVVITGALHALLVALARLRGSRWLGRAAWLAYGGLVLAVIALARSLELHGAWLLVIAVMLIGYLFAPGAIWRLSVATHEPENARGDSARDRM